MPGQFKKHRVKFYRRQDYKIAFNASRVQEGWSWLNDHIVSEETTRLQKKLRLRSGDYWCSEEIISDIKGPVWYDERFLVTMTFAWFISYEEIVKKCLHCSPELYDMRKKSCYKLFIYPEKEGDRFTKQKGQGNIALKCIDGISDRDVYYLITIRTNGKIYYWQSENRALTHNFSKNMYTPRTDVINLSEKLKGGAWLCLEIW